MPTFKDLRNEYDRTRGLWCIDRNPKEVDYDWIRRNAFQLERNLEGPDEELNEIAAGAFILRQGKSRGKIWIGDGSGKGGDVDGTVLEDLLKSIF